MLTYFLQSKSNLCASSNSIMVGLELRCSAVDDCTAMGKAKQYVGSVYVDYKPSLPTTIWPISV